MVKVPSGSAFTGIPELAKGSADRPPHVPFLVPVRRYLLCGHLNNHELLAPLSGQGVETPGFDCSSALPHPCCQLQSVVIAAWQLVVVMFPEALLTGLGNKRGKAIDGLRFSKRHFVALTVCSVAPFCLRPN
jgi:hypothetical protein